MPENKTANSALTIVAVTLFALVTAAMLLPGYLTSHSAKPPQEAQVYIEDVFARRARVFHEGGRFGRLDADVAFGNVISFDCAHSAEARREYGWRGAREVLFDCPARFEDADGNRYAVVFRLAPDPEAPSEAAPEGYRTVHIDVEVAIDLLVERGMMP